MLEAVPTSRFKKDLKKFKYNKKVIKELQFILGLLVQLKPIPEKYKNHNLGGDWKDSKECHIQPDVLLIYRIDRKGNKLFLERLGSHFELF